MDVREKLVDLLSNIYLPIMARPDVIGEYRIPHKLKKEIADHLIANGVTVEMKTIHKPDKPISTEIIDFIDWFSVEAPSEYEKGVVTGLRIAETIAEVIERNCEERRV